MSSFFRYDAAVENEIISLLGTERFAKYLADTGTNSSDAFRLYVWNVALASAFLGSIGALEVALRNALNNALGTSYGPTWYDHPSFLAIDPTGQFSNQITRAKAYIARARPVKPLTGGRIIAGLGISFWTSLLKPAYNRTLWPLLRGAFAPYTHRKTVMRYLEPLPAFRNRVAHHEPIYDRHPSEIYTNILGAAATLSPNLAPGIEHHSRVRHFLNEGPGGRSLQF